MNTRPGGLQLPNGEWLQVPPGVNPVELALPGNLRVAHADVIYGYDPTSETGIAWCRHPALHWQMIHPVTRSSFERWCESHLQSVGLAIIGDVFAKLRQLNPGIKLDTGGIFGGTAS